MSDSRDYLPPHDRNPECSITGCRDGWLHYSDGSPLDVCEDCMELNPWQTYNILRSHDAADAMLAKMHKAIRALIDGPDHVTYPQLEQVASEYEETLGHE